MPIDEYRKNGLVTPRLLLVAVLGISLIMVSLGTYLVRQYRELQLQDAAEAGGLYVEGFLASHAHEFFATGTLSAESKDKLELMLDRMPVSGHFEILKIWDQHGKFVFSTDGSTEDEDEIAVDLARALQGDILVETYTEDREHPDAPIQPPYLEIHAPILDSTNSKIIAVGEIYQDATGFMKQRATVERSIWTALGISSAFGLGGLMLLIATQRQTLLRHLAEVSAIAQQNQLLKEEADRTRIEATQSNEQLLNQIGAELHDGPIQMLTLMMLMGGKDKADDGTPQGMTSNEIGNRVISELRSISTGLSLPEIADLSLKDVLLLAISRHEVLTGQKVESALAELPENIDQGLKICCYRFVQEGLSNSYKHAGGAGQTVSADVTDKVITLRVKDDGGAEPRALPKREHFGGGIGLLGLRHRLDVFGGKLEFRQHDGGKTELIAKIPLR